MVKYAQFFQSVDPVFSALCLMAIALEAKEKASCAE